MRNLLLTFGVSAALVPTAAAWAATSCNDLETMSAPGMTIRATEVQTGTLQPPDGPPLNGLPTFCRVQGDLRPSADSEIHFEVWLPAQGWNHRYLATGNGGFAGSIGYAQMAGNLRRGFATAGQDGGHTGGAEDARWAFHHPEKVVDFGWRALHLTTEHGKAITTKFYGGALEQSYFDSCSDGGREALMEAQRFPEDFNGILAGAPAYNWTGLLTAGLDVNQRADGTPAEFIPPAKLPAITAAVLAQCDAADGLKDGFVSDPRQCHFDPASLVCKAGDAASCLTPPQVGALKAIYAGGHGTDGQQIFPGLMPGGEAGGWKGWVVNDAAAPSNYVQGFFRYMVTGDPNLNILQANVDAMGRLARERTAAALDATDPNLTPFFRRGGKLILYHGWNDPAISPLGTINYYEAVQARVGQAGAEGGVRLYMAPGMGHCTGGPGPSAFGQLGIPTTGPDPFAAFTALQGWVEQNKAPGTLLATQYAEGGKVVRTRPLCAYPAEAIWDGKGDPNSAASFTCGVRRP